MKKFTKTQAAEFILAQKDDRKVDMTEYTSDHSCGCLMVHIAKEVFNLEGEISCGGITIYTEEYQVQVTTSDGDIEEDWAFSDFNSNKRLNEIKTYADLKPAAKAHLNGKNS